MIEELEIPGCLIVLADESANWRIAGLRQLDRLAFAVNELGDSAIDLVVFWRPNTELESCWLPSDVRLKRLRVTGDSLHLKTGARVITTRLLVDRHGLPDYLTATSAVRMPELDSLSWERLHEELEKASVSSSSDNKGWKYLRCRKDTRGGDRLILGRTGKSQDGVISKFLNRPFSRPITYLLLKTSITPTDWTVAIFILPLAAFAFLCRGSYVSIVLGAALYQLYSMLDGCDGEIARAKYLESERGGRIDSTCDMLGGFLFVVGLGLGLSHSSSPPTVLYTTEGLLSALLVAAHEQLLRLSKQEVTLEASELTGATYSRHRQMIEQSGVLFLGEKFVWWILQLSKRDVLILAFFLVAVAGLAPWILHYSVIAAAVGLWLSGRAYLSALWKRTS